jgi:Ca2+-binding RTX toxin-like protein
MATNSAQEQLMLELINRARMNPVGEATRLGINLNQGLPAGTISGAPKQVLAMNDLLVIAADNHSNWMLVNGQFAHQEALGFPSGRTGLDPVDRMAAAGYVFPGLAFPGENISWSGVLPGPINLTSAIVAQHNSLFLSPGHRTNILNATFEEVGIGQQHGTFSGYDASMVTQNFAPGGTQVFVTGVVYNDTVVNDNFFSVGEQTAGRSVAGTGGVTDVTGGGGGYELAFTAGGAKTIGFSLATGAIQLAVTVPLANVKIDVVNGHEVWTNAHTSVVSGPVTELHVLGIQAINLTGGAGGNDSITGGPGNDNLIGGLGIDTLVGGTHNDYFVFNAPLNSANRDTITDFNHVNDAFRLENAVMKTIGGPGMLNAAFFRAGATALDANDHIIYNKASGYIDYDSNGNAAGGVTHLALLTNKPVNVAFNDFVVI